MTNRMIAFNPASGWVFQGITSTILRGTLSGLLLLALVCQPAAAQVTTATISGTVKDESGALLPGVSVTMRNVNTGITRTVISDDQGRYRAPELALGDYEVEAELSGFQTAVRTGIRLTVGREAVVEITLRVGEISEKVVVSGEAPLVETASSTITGLVDDKQIRDLPLNGRSFTQLAALQEGVASPTNFASAQPGNEGQKLSIAGTRITETAFLLDGTDIRNHFGTTPGSVAGVLLGVDTVREFSVVTSAASAEYGGFTGGVVNAVTRSGTNQLHGSIFEFHRNSALDARNFFDRGATPPPFKRNQFGFTLGGPIVRDKTFFFGSYEGLRDRLTTTAIVNVPDENAHRGILPAAQGGNVGVHPNVKPYLDLYPLPNGRNFGNGVGELIYPRREPTNEDYFMVKVDHNLSDADSIFVRYTFDDGEKNAPSALPIFNEFRFNRAQFVTIEERKILSPKLINEFRFAFNRNKSLSTSEPLVPVDPSLKYIPLADRTFGTVGVSGITGWGPSPLAALDQILNRFEYADNLSFTSGRHSIKTGFKFSRLQFNLTNGVFAHGQYSFTSLANFLRGTAFFGSAVLGHVVPPAVVGPLIKQGLRNSVIAMYVQDSFAWTPRFTLNAGLRYEFQTNPTEVGGRVSNLDEPMDTVLRVGNPLFARNPSLKNFAPRVGIAWDPFGSGKTSIRAGGGIFYNLVDSQRLLGPQAQPPFFTRVTVSGAPFPNLLSAIPDITRITPGIFVYKTPNQAYVGQYNLTIQQEIAPLTVVTVGYQGSRGIKLGRLTDANIGPFQIVDGRYFWPVCTTPGGCRQNRAFAQMRMYEWDTASFFNSVRFGLRRRFGQGFQLQSSYTYGRSVDENSNTANFDGPGTSNGIMNLPFDRKADRALSAFDVRHTYSFNALVELPFGPGKRFGSNSTGAAARIIGGWQMAGLVSLSTGPPVNLRVTSNRSRSQAGPDLSERPDLRPAASNSPVLSDGRDPNRYYDVGAFVLQPAGFWGTLGRNSLIGPGVANLDLSFIKDTALWGEGKTLQFRAEFFNLLNRPNFGSPDGNVFGATEIPLATAGRITATTTTARQIQFALKIVF